MDIPRPRNVRVGTLGALGAYCRTLAAGKGTLATVCARCRLVGRE